MTYTPVPEVFIGNLWDALDFNKYYMDNFDAGTGLVTSKGDMLVATGSKNAERLGIGSDDEVLVADSSESGGVKWEEGGNVQTGMIIIWSGAIGDIPSGWVICDGNNSTPDLRNRFVGGAGATYAVDDSGGATTLDISHSHTMNGVVAENDHSHVVTTGTENAHRHAFSNAASGAGGVAVDAQAEPFPPPYTDVPVTVSAASHTHNWNGNSPAPNTPHNHVVPVSSDGAHTHTLTTAASSNESMATVPPYYALAYIMKVAA